MGSKSEQAELHKKAGNEHYKRKEFVKAVEEYEKAIGLDPNEITFYTNLAAVKFETKDYAGCVQTCSKAVEVGRENRADFKLIAKALARKGNALRKMGNLAEAKVAYEKALTEHRTPEYRTALSEIETLIKKQLEEAYIDPELSEQEKQAGNELFKVISLRSSSSSSVMNINAFWFCVAFCRRATSPARSSGTARPSSGTRATRSCTVTGRPAIPS